jgi:integrase
MLELSDRLAPGTLQIVRRALCSFYHWAHDPELIDTNPAASVPAVRQPEVAVRTPGPEIPDALVKACRLVRVVAIFQTLFGSGWRQGELQVLRLAHVDMTARTLLIERSKTGKTRLDVRGPVENDALWLTDEGTALKPSGFKTTVQRVSERAGIIFSAHDARRAFAVVWLAAGDSETDLMSVAGWSSVEMVKRYVWGRQSDLAISEAQRLFMVVHRDGVV